jgi:hypothetical protein
MGLQFTSAIGTAEVGMARSNLGELALAVGLAGPLVGRDQAEMAHPFHRVAAGCAMTGAI